jgi:hypothetical protein
MKVREERKVVGAWIRVPYHGYGPPPDDEPGWEWSDPVPWVDEFGLRHPGFGEWTRPTTRAERSGRRVSFPWVSP